MKILIKVLGSIGNIADFIYNKIDGHSEAGSEYLHEDRETFYD